ncbi:DUF3592 domain-containing protein [Gilvimarinus algae]|uniref:DUF3592 domain-containing protein n=1 Tax=Gilvimarinus algae TaxID=3058037 RepID=A0ABT8TCS9_9GAMM|nr:DUF3592 domain-containing protein [Gilvimarinus sp. SDUM040014]MDO3381904.1 DUF3592 domain-containing protein [Gilvimarinus sp. SDUM040014]
MSQPGFQLGQKLKERWLLLLFGLPFAAVGIGFALFGVIPQLKDWQSMQRWEEVPAEIEQVELKSHRSDGSTTYEVIARYRYDYSGRPYQGQRVGVASGADNIGDFQQNLYDRLRAAKDKARPVPAYVNPEQPAEAVLNRELRGELVIFKLVFVVVFGLVGLGIWAYALLARPDKAAGVAEADAQVKPWLTRNDWAPVISSDGKVVMYAAWGITIFWNAIAIPAAVGAVGEALGGNHAAYIALIFPAVGMGLLAWAVKATLAWRRFGPAPLTLDPYPGSIGGQVGGTIDVNLPYRHDQVFEVVLQCVRIYYSGSGKNRKRRESLVWQREGAAHTQRTARGTRLSILFDVEDGLPVSQAPDNNYHLWRLSMTCELEGADFDRSYEIPVFATAQNAQALREPSTAHSAAEQKREQALESVLNIRQIPGGVIVHYPAFKHIGGKFILLLVGGIFTAVGFAVPSDDFPAWLFALIGAPMALAGLYLLTRSLDVRLDQNALITRTRILGASLGNRRTPRSEITGLALAESYSSQSGRQHTTFYKLQAVHRSGKKTTIGYNLAGRDVAEQALESFSLLTGVPQQ